MFGLPVAGIVIGTGVGYVIRKKVAEKQIGSAEDKAQEIVKTARLRAEAAKKEMIIEAKDEVHKARVDLDKEIKERRNEISRAERRQIQREENLEKKLNSIDKKEDQIQRKIKETNEKKEEVERLHQIQMTELERISGLTRDEAKTQLLNEVEKDIRHDSIVMMKDIESRAKEEAEKNAKNILSFAIQKCAADHVAETTVSVVNLPNDEMKGRIIGREGRNIRALETLTGVDLIIDDTPEAVILSSFDPIRREVARVALEKLIVDGRIHPARIEEMVNKAQKEIDAQIKQEGENATFDVGIHNLHPELVKLIGRLKFRTSYGQNVLKHSQEVAYLAGIMAAEIGADARLAKRAGLLHDIGKAVDHEIEGTHIEIGMNLLKKYKESKHVIHAMSTHHGDYEPETIEAVLVTAADAISAARPGARRETLENYVNRLESLEKIANDKAGVDYSYAIQAGREIRIMVMPDKITDDDMVLLARDIKKQVEEELEYPGHIKIHMIRETRHVNYAK
ncbi:ribonuclease Y [Acidaminobacter sp. JC074]|nr:ribonuclease Y [Acidaminobacter sp. JC074]MCH4890931.1 ribonuclease Y [Acidaminobacter sp. JC074]